MYRLISLAMTTHILVTAFFNVHISQGANAPRRYSRSQDDVRLSNSQFELLYMVAQTAVWLVFRRTDRQLIHKEMTRLFKGPLGLHYDLQKDADNPEKLVQNEIEKKPSLNALADGNKRRSPEQIEGFQQSRSSDKGQVTGYKKNESRFAKILSPARKYLCHMIN